MKNSKELQNILDIKSFLTCKKLRALLTTVLFLIFRRESSSPRLQRLVRDLLETCQRLVGDLLENCWRLVGDQLETCLDLLETSKRLVGDLLETCQWLVKDILETFSRLVGDLLQRFQRLLRFQIFVRKQQDNGNPSPLQCVSQFQVDLMITKSIYDQKRL